MTEEQGVTNDSADEENAISVEAPVDLFTEARKAVGWYDYDFRKADPRSPRRLVLNHSCYVVFTSQFPFITSLLPHVCLSRHARAYQ